MNKLKLFKTEEIEIVVDEITGETYASISATARMCKVDESSIRRFIKTSAQSTIKSAKIQTTQGIRTSALLNEELILDCLYEYNPRLTRAFAQMGLRKYFHTEIGYKHTNKKSLYPDRSIEYKELYNQIKELLKKTGAGKHNYIQLNQTLNSIVGKIDGRSNNTLNETENLAYCLLMRRAINAGNTALNKTSGFKTREFIQARLIEDNKEIKAIKQALDNLS